VQEDRSSNDSTAAQPLRARARPAVLIVDDDLGTLETVDWVLRQAGYQVGMASSGKSRDCHQRRAAFEQARAEGSAEVVKS
jgi:CheY-like chemotaxis protein